MYKKRHLKHFTSNFPSGLSAQINPID